MTSTPVAPNVESVVNVSTASNGDHDLAAIGKTIRTDIGRCSEPEEITRQVGKTVAGIDGVVGACLVAWDAHGQCSAPPHLVCRQAYARQAPLWEKTIFGIAASVRDTATGQFGVIVGSSHRFCVAAAPVIVAESVCGVVCVVTDQSEEVTRRCMLVAQLTAAELGKHFAAINQRTSDASRDERCVVDPSTDQDSTGPRFWHDVVVKSAGRKEFSLACREIADALQQRLGVASVMIGLRTSKRKHCRLVGVSDNPLFSKQSVLATRAEEVFDEAIVRRRTVRIATDTATADATDASRELLQLCEAPGLASGPLDDFSGEPIGAWIVVEESRPMSAAEPCEPPTCGVELTHLFKDLGPCLDVLWRARLGLLRRCIAWAWKKEAGTRRRTIAVVTGLLLFAMLIPLPYRIKCDCTLQPVTRRYVPVPHDGVLNEVLVEPGDVVKAGQVLARMDGREIEWELAARRAEFTRAKKQHDASLAVANTSESQIARLEMERLDVQIQLLRDRIENLEIRSPIDGIVIGGDPKKRQGARLVQGENLFEAGPLEKMLVEVYVPDEEISQVAEAQRTVIRFDAFASRTFAGPIERISPSAEPRDQQNVFVAEVALDNANHLLRPGMSGRCRIRAGVHPLGWNLFHKAWHALAQALVW